MSAARVTGRFVVQEHHTDPLHWDFMLERDGVLKTWSLPQPPAPDALPLEALQHFDHRLAYLDYEGEISGGRGRVRLWDRGTFEADWDDARLDLRLHGARLAGDFTLVFSAPGQRPAWILRTSRDATDSREPGNRRGVEGPETLHPQGR